MTLNFGADGWKMVPSFTLGGIGNWSGQSMWRILKKAKVQNLLYPSILHLGLCPKNSATYDKKTYSVLFLILYPQ